MNVTARFMNAADVQLVLEDDSTFGDLKAVLATDPTSPVYGVEPTNLATYDEHAVRENTEGMDEGGSYLVLVQSAPIAIPGHGHHDDDSGSDSDHDGDDGGHHQYGQDGEIFHIEV